MACFRALQGAHFGEERPTLSSTCWNSFFTCNNTACTFLSPHKPSFQIARVPALCSPRAVRELWIKQGFEEWALRDGGLSQLSGRKTEFLALQPGAALLLWAFKECDSAVFFNFYFP